MICGPAGGIKLIMMIMIETRSSLTRTLGYHDITIAKGTLRHGPGTAIRVKFKLNSDSDSDTDAGDLQVQATAKPNLLTEAQ
jgi:hypothetical protein